LTGVGDYAFAIPQRTGYLAQASLSPLPQMIPYPDVNIGGRKAAVTFAGPVAGSTLGVLRVDAIVPEGGTTGNTVPLTVRIGTFTAQSGVTVCIKK
jgi:uncharacterized protein (TIGR03437 family)